MEDNLLSKQVKKNLAKKIKQHENKKSTKIEKVLKYEKWSCMYKVLQNQKTNCL